MIVLSWLVACTPPEPSSDRESRHSPDTGTEHTGGTPTGTTGTTGQTGDTGVVVPPVDCSTLVAAADITFTSTREIVTEEDFDFDGQGYLITQRDNDLQGIDRAAGSHFVASNVGPDATGIRSTAQGYITVAQPSDGTVRLVDPATGGSLVLLADLNNPNGLEAGEDGMVYLTENTQNGRLRMIDPTNGDFQIIDQVPYANGIVLSPDDQTLYLSSSTGFFGGSTHVVAIDRGDDGTWDASTRRVVYTHPAYVGSLTIDACGNLYGVEYSQGRVFRLDTATLVAEMLVDLQGPGSFSALHFSPGFGDWDLNSLYVTSRFELYEIPTGVPGSHVLTP